MELADAVEFVLKSRPLELPPKALEQLTEETRARLARLRAALAQVSDWSVAGLEVAVRAFAEADGVGIGKFGAPLRSVTSLSMLWAALPMSLKVSSLGSPGG